MRPERVPGGALQNRLLATLPPDEQRRLEPFLVDVDLRNRDVVARRGETIEALYFPIDCVTSTLMELPEGETVEVGLMGAEGVTGLSVLYGLATSNTTVIVQVAGRATRIAADDFQRHVVERRGPPLELLFRYANAFMAVVAQIAACNASHDIGQRFARWLLMIHDRVARDEFPLTHEFAALMLGVRRASVTNAASALRLAGAIDYDAGRVLIQDRLKLLDVSCGCYAAISETLESIFHVPASADGAERPPE